MTKIYGVFVGNLQNVWISIAFPAELTDQFQAPLREMLFSLATR